MRKLLVTGHAGFVGRTVRAILDADPDAFDGTFVALPDDCDIRTADLAAQIAAIQPDAVLHLAGLTSVADSFHDPEAFFDVNFHGTWNLLEALRSTGFRGRFLFVSSGDCYGVVMPADLPVDERHPLRPRSPYAVSKAAAECLCYQWSQTAPFDVIIARSFNHIGPGQNTRFAIASFAAQVASIRAGIAEPIIRTGNLDVTRDLTDVRDVVRAYFALLDRGKSAETYNVGSGKETRLDAVLDVLIELGGVDVKRVTDPARLRADEQRRAAASIRKILSDTGWTAAIALRTTLCDMLEDWKRTPR